MKEWELTSEEKKAIKDEILKLNPSVSGDRGEMMINLTARQAQKKLVEWLIFKKMEGFAEYSGHHCFVVTMETLRELCKKLGITSNDRGLV